MLGIAASLILCGLAHIVGGRLHYKNYWGGLVFAPLTIAVGVLLLCIAVFRLERFRSAWRDRKGRPVRFPADDFRKW
jgi:hypothetical protein